MVPDVMSGAGSSPKRGPSAALSPSIGPFGNPLLSTHAFSRHRLENDVHVFVCGIRAYQQTCLPTDEHEHCRTAWIATEASQPYYTSEPIMVGDRSLDGQSIAVRENLYRGVFGTVKQKSRNRDLPVPKVVVRHAVLREGC